MHMYLIFVILNIQIFVNIFSDSDYFSIWLFSENKHFIYSDYIWLVVQVHYTLEVTVITWPLTSSCMFSLFHGEPQQED